LVTEEIPLYNDTAKPNVSSGGELPAHRSVVQHCDVPSFAMSVGNTSLSGLA
jgi:hypothetical protein